MKIVHVTTLRPASDLRIIAKEGRTLAEAGHEVHVLSPWPGGHRDGVRLHTLAASTEPGLRNLRRRLSEATSRARALRADVYHLHDPELIPLALLLKAFRKTVVYDANEDTPREVRSLNPDRPVVAWVHSTIWSIAEPLCGAVVDAVVVATPSIGLRFPKRKTVVVRNYPTVEERGGFVGGPHSERPLNVAYVGGITEIRGIRELVAAIARVTDPRARLVLAGPSPPSRLMRDLEAAPGWKRVEFRGWLSRTGIAEVLRETRVGMLVLHPVAAHLESLPVKLFEYMGAGVPVVASDFPLWREIIESAGCGLLVDPFDADEIAAAIDRLLASPTEAQAMGARGRAAVADRFGWEREGERLVALYERLG